MPYARPSGSTRFRVRSAAKLGLPSAWIDQEFDALYTAINGMTLIANTSEWSLYGAAVTYVSGTDFTILGDQTAEFYAKRRIQANLAVSYVYSKVSSSTYNGGTGLTTVVLADSVLTVLLNQIFYGIIQSNKTINSISAEMIPSTAYAALAATDVQAALEELESEKLQSGDVFGNWVVSGLFGTDPGATLTMTTPSGVCHQTGKRVVSAGFTYAYTASKDTYDDINSAGTITHVAVNNGAGAPAITADSQRLQKVVTNGTEITSVTDLRVIMAPMANDFSTPAANAIPIRNSTKDLLDRNSNPLYAAGVSNVSSSGATVTTTRGGIAVTNGDILVVQSTIQWVAGATEAEYVAITPSGVTYAYLTSLNFCLDQFDVTTARTYTKNLFVIMLITQTGTLSLDSFLLATSPTSITNAIGCAFLKKQ